tara:strand:- start:798 stop:1052 length:255 start_codon:yes stop_codon:yes gene_type:complete
VTRLEGAREEAIHNLKESQKQKQTAEGSRELLDKIRSETEDKINNRKKEIEELEKLEKLVRPEREVKLGDPRQQQRSGQEDLLS